MDINAELYGIMHKMEENGWTPLMTIATQHGEDVCFHIFAAEFHEDKSKDRYAYFRRSQNQNVVKDSNKFYDGMTEFQSGYDGLQKLISPIKHIEVDVDKFMEAMKEVA